MCVESVMCCVSIVGKPNESMALCCLVILKDLITIITCIKQTQTCINI